MQLVSPQTHICIYFVTLQRRKLQNSLVSVNWGKAEDILETVWSFFGSWWPSWSMCSMTLSSLFFFFQVSDSPALFITPQDQQLLTDSLSVTPCCISSEHKYVPCKCNIQARDEYKRERNEGTGSAGSILITTVKGHVWNFTLGRKKLDCYYQRVKGKCKLTEIYQTDQRRFKYTLKTVYKVRQEEKNI